MTTEALRAKLEKFSIEKKIIKDSGKSVVEIENGVLHIRLPCGSITLLDGDNSYLLEAFPAWSLNGSRKGGEGYVHITRTIRTGFSYVREQLKVHQIVMGEKMPGFLADHINRNPLDNRRANLRWATKSQNGANGKPSGKYSKYRGVYQDGSCMKTKPWRSHVVKDGRRHYLGRFETEIEAALAYNAVARELHGEFAYQNVIEALKGSADA